MPKSIPVSLRISQEDAAFISGLEVQGAVTPSEKIRSIIQEARKFKEDGSAPARLVTEMHGHLKALHKQILNVERSENTHSELIRFALDWQNQFTQALAQEDLCDASTKQELEKFEDLLASQLFQLIDYAVRLGVTPTAPCYNPNIIREKLAEHMELLRLVEKQVTKGSKNG